MTCLDPETIAAYVDGRLTPDELGAADRHVDTCGSCRRELSALAAVATAPAAPAAGETRGRLGRFLVMRELGHGAMGSVLRAYDPELDRAVAVKVLHRIDAGASDRLRREAQAMARLAHPNVVAVYDVVADADLVFVAMELVEGVTLRVHARDRPWQETLAACIAAGRGLAAAHAAKLVHRDFKPDNVLCGADGRVAVSDFGLAHPVDSGDEQGVAGTPAYMAPEVYRGETATLASDQFSFCAATYEMLYGARAFAGEDLGDLRSAILEGSPREPPANSPVRRSVWRALARGLSRDPAERFPSMTELLDALEVDPAVPRRRGIALAGALGVALGTGALVVGAMASDGPSCEIGAGELGAAWDGGRRATVEASVRAASGDPVRVVAALDAYTASWLDARREACAATRLQGIDTARVLEGRNACLDRARHQLDALTGLLARADRVLAARAVEAVYRLRDPASCRVDIEAPVRLPESDELDRVAALFAIGRDEEADAIAKRVIETLPPGGAPELLAEALLWRGTAAGVATKAEESLGYLYDALAAAQRARDDRLVAETWIAILATTGTIQHDFGLARMAARAASAAMGRIDVDRSLEASYEQKLGVTLLSEGKTKEARDHLMKALALQEADKGRPGNAGITRGSLCDLETRDRKLELAKQQCAKAIVELEAAFGPDNVIVATTLLNDGSVALEQGRFDDAERSYARSIAIFERRGLREHLGYALAHTNFALVWASREDYARATPLFERARDLFAAHHPKHPQRAVVLAGLADVAYNRRDFPTAIRVFEEARAVAEATYAKSSQLITQILYNMSNAYTEHHDFARAGAVLDEVIDRATAANRYQFVGRALEGKAAIADLRNQPRVAIALRERALAAFDRQDDPFARAWTEQLLGDALLADKQPVRAIAPLERTAAYYGKRAADHPFEAGGAWFSLARALWESNRDRARAVTLARDAKAALDRTDVRDAEALRREVGAWLAARAR